NKKEKCNGRVKLPNRLGSAGKTIDKSTLGSRF
uniref:Uncharacterized protein n=1 Tax=Ciona savignyi TaxID=51511 RepID=H2ZKC9_CIOSA